MALEQMGLGANLIGAFQTVNNFYASLHKSDLRNVTTLVRSRSNSEANVWCSTIILPAVGPGRRRRAPGGGEVGGGKREGGLDLL